jgi:imidazole glycerol-phosphate synthase subunit HisH
VSITIIDCGAGNLHSVHKAFAHITQQPIAIVRDAAALTQATHIVLPGVGAFGDVMNGLRALPGMIAALETRVLHGHTPFLGICVGMQILFEAGVEHGTHAGLGWFRGTVKKLAPADASLRIPHMGWNRLQLHAPNHPMLQNIAQGDYAYFVHSYAAMGIDNTACLASADYGGRVVAMVGRAHIMATQFHPEKSQTLGLQLLRNFLEL